MSSSRKLTLTVDETKLLEGMIEAGSLKKIATAIGTCILAQLKSAELSGQSTEAIEFLKSVCGITIEEEPRAEP